MQRKENSIWNGPGFHHQPVRFPDLLANKEYQAFQVVIQNLVRLFAQPEIVDWFAWAENREENILWELEASRMQSEAGALLAYGGKCADKRLYRIGGEIALAGNSLVTFAVSRGRISWEVEGGSEDAMTEFAELMDRVWVVDVAFDELQVYFLFYKDASKARAKRIALDAECAYEAMRGIW